MYVFHVESGCECHADHCGAFEVGEHAEGLIEFFPGFWDLWSADLFVGLLVWGAEADVELCGFFFEFCESLRLGSVCD